MNPTLSLRLGSVLLGTALCYLFVGAMYAQSASLNSATTASAPDVILVDITGYGMHNNHHWQYEVSPYSRQIRLVKDEQFKHGSHTDLPRSFQEPAGAVQNCEGKPSAAAPDGRLTAQCTGRSFREEISIVETGSSHEVTRWTHKDRSVSGFAWAPDGLSLAILNQSEHYGKNPLGILSGASGHPIPHKSVFLDVVDIQTGKVSEHLIKENVLYALSRILKW